MVSIFPFLLPHFTTKTYDIIRDSVVGKFAGENIIAVDEEEEEDVEEEEEDDGDDEEENEEDMDDSAPHSGAEQPRIKT